MEIEPQQSVLLEKICANPTLTDAELRTAGVFKDLESPNATQLEMTELFSRVSSAMNQTKQPRRDPETPQPRPTTPKKRREEATFSKNHIRRKASKPKIPSLNDLHRSLSQLKKKSKSVSYFGSRNSTLGWKHKSR